MRIKAIATAAVLTLGLGLSACGSSNDDTSTSGSSDSTSAAATTSSSPTMEHHGSFTGANGKNVAGTVKVSGHDITLSGFSSDEGPDLHIYLTNGTNEAAVSAGKEISTVKFNEASQSFMVDGTDLSSYTTVVIHCDKAHAVFGTAHLM